MARRSVWWPEIGLRAEDIPSLNVGGVRNFLKLLFKPDRLASKAVIRLTIRNLPAVDSQTPDSLSFRRREVLLAR